jgi:hypothetical protein
VKCRGQQTGYYCPSDSPPAGSDMAFACMDWTFGSKAMQAAEEAFTSRTSADVYFGVGTFGSSDEMRGIGACYRLKVDTTEKDLIVQSVNTGSDVAGSQFDLQVGDGGAGAFNTCAGGGMNSSMYPGSYDPWGKQYGGVDNRAQCAGLPKYPQISGPMTAAGDDLVSLCQYSFDKRVRGEGGSNPTLLDISRVTCPEELIFFTQIQRSDDPSPETYAIGADREADEAVGLKGFPNMNKYGVPVHECQAGQPGGSTAYCLTRMMDCRKPSGAFKDNVKESLVVSGRKLVQPCLSDGYTRIDVQCGCADCYC